MKRVLFLLLVLPLLLTSCRDSTLYPGGGNRGGGSGGDLDLATAFGVDWTLDGFVSTVGNAEQFEGVPDGQVFTLAFRQTEGRAGGMADCKGYDYSYAATSVARGSKLSFDDPAPQIAIYCGDNSVDGRFYGAMESAHGYRLVDSRTLYIYYGSDPNDRSQALLFRSPAPAGAKEITFVPFATVLHSSRGYTLEPMGLTNDPTTITIEDDFISIPVAYSGGCEEHTFTLYADEGGRYDCGSGTPCAQDLHLIHTSPEDFCQAYLTEVHTYDLRPLKQRYIDAGITSGSVDLTIHTLDGSGQKKTVTWTF